MGLPPEARSDSSSQRCSNTNCSFVKHDEMTPHSDSTFGGRTGTANVSTRSAARSSSSFSTSIAVFFTLIASASAHTSSFLSSFHTDTTPNVGTKDFKYSTVHSYQTFLRPDEIAEHSSSSLSLWGRYATTVDSFLADIPFFAEESDPISFKEARASANWDITLGWKDAIELELGRWTKMGVYEDRLFNLSEVRQSGSKPLGLRWVLTVKTDKDGRFLKCKARLVVLGHRAIEGMHYKETFASTVRHCSFRTCLAIAASRKFPIHKQCDISTAFCIHP